MQPPRIFKKLLNFRLGPTIADPLQPPKRRLSLAEV